MFIKALLYRFYSCLILLAVMLVYTQDPKRAFKISIGVELLKALQYWIFERLWNSLQAQISHSQELRRKRDADLSVR